MINSKKILLISLLILSFLFSQNDPNVENNKANGTPEETTAENNNNNNNNSEEADNLKIALANILNFNEFEPNSLEKEFIQEGYEQKLLDGLLDSLAIISNELRSPKLTLGYINQDIKNQLRLRNIDYYRLNFGFKPNLYPHIVNNLKVRHNFFFDKSYVFLEQIEKVFENNKGLMFVSDVFTTRIINSIIFQTKYLLGTILLFKNSTVDLIVALEKFKYLIGKNDFKKDYVPNQIRKEFYSTVISICDRLIDLYHFSPSRRVLTEYYSHEKLYFLWELVKINHINKEKIKNFKLRKLFMNYALVMNPESERYKEVYSKYHQEGDPYPIKRKEYTEEENTQGDNQSQDNQSQGNIPQDNQLQDNQSQGNQPQDNQPQGNQPPEDNQSQDNAPAE